MQLWRFVEVVGWNWYSVLVTVVSVKCENFTEMTPQCMRVLKPSYKRRINYKYDSIAWTVLFNQFFLLYSSFTLCYLLRDSISNRSEYQRSG